MATLTRKVALEVLSAIRELEERARIPLSVSVSWGGGGPAGSHFVLLSCIDNSFSLAVTPLTRPLDLQITTKLTVLVCVGTSGLLVLAIYVFCGLSRCHGVDSSYCATFPNCRCYTAKVFPL